MKLIGFSILVLSLTACVKVSDSHDGEEAALNKADATSPASRDFSAHIRELSSPNHYVVSLPVPLASERVYRFEKSAGAETKLEVPMQVADGRLVDIQAEAGKTYVYKYVSKNSSEDIAVLEAGIPQDMVVTAEISLQQNTTWNQYRRIFFNRGGVITLNSYELRVEADQVISADGVIRAFPDGSKAPQMAAGQSGGRILMNFRTGTGFLHFDLRGQNGGEGLSEARSLDPFGNLIIRPGFPGARGGDSGSGEMRISEAHDLSWNITLLGGQGGAGGGPGAPAGSAGGPRFFCIEDFQNHQCPQN